MFFIGQRVACIKDFDPKWNAPIKRGDVLTTIAVYIYPTLDEVGLEFAEVSSVTGFKGYWGKYFRPVIDKKTDISIFIKMLNPDGVKQKEKVT